VFRLCAPLTVVHEVLPGGAVLLLVVGWVRAAHGGYHVGVSTVRTAHRGARGTARGCRPATGRRVGPSSPRRLSRWCFDCAHRSPWCTRYCPGVPSCYWSSGGSEQPTEAITLVFRLCAPLTVVHEVLPGGAGLLLVVGWVRAAHGGYHVGVSTVRTAHRGARGTARGLGGKSERERERVDLVGSHGRWKRPCLQTAHITPSQQSGRVHANGASFTLTPTRPR
jgi:fructose 1,6-bisphosphatase